jgi:hypothetical protein
MIAPMLVPPSPGVAAVPLIDALIDTLGAERRLLDDLSAIMLRQRAAISVDDLQGVDDSVFAVQRVLHTMAEARKRRRMLLERLGADGDTAPRDLCDALGVQGTDQVRRACEALESAARALSREVAVNRDVLKQGLATGEQFIRLLAGFSQPKATGYPDRGDGASAPILVNRQA